VHVSEARRTLPRVASAVLVSLAVAILSVPAAQSASPARASRPAARTVPADLYRGQQWTLDALHIPRAWKYSRGNGVTVAVLDTGVDGRQPDLSGRVIDGPDFTGHTRKPGGRYWGRHGTEMASLIAGHGHGPNAASGVMGVAPDAKILSIRVTWELDDPIRTDRAQVDRARDAVAKGIQYAADNGAKVISMSLGGGNLFYNGNAAEEAAIKYALGKGAVLVASAGNDGNGANRRNYPAAYPGVIAVGAVDRSFKAAKFTNRHTYISVAAPGVEIVSADVAGHGYILGTGTSSSAAFVAGMAALIEGRYPNLTPAEVRQALEEGATHRPPDGRSTEIGTGVVDAFGALRTAARINKAEHGGTAVERPAPTAQPAAQAAKQGPDLMLIAVLSGGGTLILLSLILGWRQRRHRAPDDDDDDLAGESRPEPVPARSQMPSAEPSPFERRPSGPAPSGRSPWQRRPPESAAGETPAWSQTADDSPPITPWDRRTAEPAAGDAPAWNQAADDSPPITPWDRRRPESPSDAEPSPQQPPARDESWDPPAARFSWERQPSSWDSGLPASDDSWRLPAADSTWERFAPEPEDPPGDTAPPPGAAPAESYQPYEPPPSARTEGNGSNGHHKSGDFRVADGGTSEPDPLTDDAPFDSASDMGTPLADESWDSIRRGFDRLKDASSWESLANGDLDDPTRLPDSDDTAAMPIDPDEDDEKGD
jgi:type VII secretion-associated serine protease mycosin